MILFGTPYRCMRVLNDSKWLRGSFNPSYASTYGILNLVRRGKDVIGAVKGESIRWTSSSKLVDTWPLRAFSIISIFSFIVCISYAMRNTPTSSLEGWLVSCWYHLLKALLSSWSSISWWSFVPILSIILIIWLLIIPLLQLSFQLVVPLGEPFNHYGKGLHLPL